MKQLIDKDGNCSNYLEFDEYREYLFGEVSNSVLEHWKDIGYNFSVDIFPVLLTNAVYNEEIATISLYNYVHNYSKYFSLPNTEPNIEEYLNEFERKLKAFKASKDNYGCKYVFNVELFHKYTVNKYTEKVDSKIIAVFTSYSRAYDCVKKLNEQIFRTKNEDVPISEYNEFFEAAHVKINKIGLNTEPDYVYDDEKDFSIMGTAEFDMYDDISHLEVVSFIDEKDYEYPTFFDKFVNYPFPFKPGDIVRDIHTNRVGIVGGSPDDAIFKEKSKFNKLEMGDNTFFNENGITVNFVSLQDEHFYSEELVCPLKLEYYSVHDIRYRACKALQDIYNHKMFIDPAYIKLNIESDDFDE